MVRFLFATILAAFLGFVLEKVGVVDGAPLSWVLGAIVAVLVVALVMRVWKDLSGVTGWVALALLLVAGFLERQVGQTATLYDLTAGLALGLFSVLFASVVMKTVGARGARA